jgi:hypothetical protein
MAQPLFVRGEKRELVDGRKVTVIERCGDAYKVVNERGRVELVYPSNFKREPMEGH